jgi:hypothetical protein
VNEHHIPEDASDGCPACDPEHFVPCVRCAATFEMGDTIDGVVQVSIVHEPDCSWFAEMVRNEQQHEDGDRARWN